MNSEAIYHLSHTSPITTSLDNHGKISSVISEMDSCTTLMPYCLSYDKPKIISSLHNPAIIYPLGACELIEFSHATSSNFSVPQLPLTSESMRVLTSNTSDVLVLNNETSGALVVSTGEIVETDFTDAPTSSAAAVLFLIAIS